MGSVCWGGRLAKGGRRGRRARERKKARGRWRAREKGLQRMHLYAQENSPTSHSLGNQPAGFSKPPPPRHWVVFPTPDRLLIIPQSPPRGSIRRGARAVHARCGYWGCSVDPFIQSGGMVMPQEPTGTIYNSSPNRPSPREVVQIPDAVQTRCARGARAVRARCGYSPPIASQLRPGHV